MISKPIEELLQPEQYQGLTRDFAEFCMEEWQRKHFAAESFDEDLFIQASRLVLDSLAPVTTPEPAEADDDH